MGQPPLPPAPLAHEDDSPDAEDEGPSDRQPQADELGVNREALAFVAGYVAFKCGWRPRPTDLVFSGASVLIEPLAGDNQPRQPLRPQPVVDGRGGRL